MLQQKYISNVITEEVARKWNKGSNYIIKAGTNSGKTTFIIKVLAKLAIERETKILLLCHRATLKDQVDETVKKEGYKDIIDVRCYQLLEKRSCPSLAEYGYIVCDECHYFIFDSIHNDTTYISYEKVMSSDTIRVFLSATIGILPRLIEETSNKQSTIYDEGMSDYTYVKSINIFTNKYDMRVLVDEAIERDSKTIIFCHSNQEAYELHLYASKFTESAFICSTNNDKWKDKIDTDTYEEIITQEKFSCHIVFCSTCLSTGINIIDKDLETIVCNLFSPVDIVQSIGRKRDKENSLDVYIMAYSNKQLIGKKRTMNNSQSLKMADELIKTGADAILEKYGSGVIKQNPLIIFRQEKDKMRFDINLMQYAKRQLSMIEVDKMIVKGKEYKDKGHIYYVLSEMGIWLDILDLDDELQEKIHWIDDEVKRDNTLNYLNAVLDKPLDKDEQKELIELLNITDDRNRLQKGINAIRGYLVDNYNIDIITKRITINRKKPTVWILKRIEK